MIEKREAVIVRYPGQRILIGDFAVIRVLKVQGARVFVRVETNNGLLASRPPKEEDLLDKKMSAIRNEQSLNSGNTKK